ncbi:precorrin-3B synthase [Chelatococcus caeni]|uniref:Precorrin-3B synthase n=1 Tax=Chelatococcus caeni TaxID=1348468 RepID=A0A840C109_9HYPH|nr:nitrite reductase [Chelatococcus caeni]MBB4019235.1 precorrin-3B synthase [Chelatococcus caeni]
MSGAAPVPASRRGWCPGIARPMATGDGLLVRIHPRHGCLTTAQLGGLADLAERYGNGPTDVTSRGNLQLRGVAEADHGALSDALAGLGFIDDLPATGPQRIVFLDPLAGLDGLRDLRPLADAIEAALRPLRAKLPGKFCIALGHEGTAPAVAADLEVAVDADGNAVVRLRDVWPPEADAPYSPPTCGEGLGVGVTTKEGGCLPGWTPPLPNPPPQGGREQAAGLPVRIAALVSEFLANNPGKRSPRQRNDVPANYLGLLPAGEQPILAVAPAFGRLAAADMRRLAGWAGRHGAGELRLTPSRAVLIPHLDRGAADGLMREARAAGFIVDADDPRVLLVACPGRPACRSAFAPAQADALRLAGVAGLFGAMHVSGCAKGCARQAPAPLTLVGEAGGYGVVLDGTARDAPLAVRSVAEIETLLQAVVATGPSRGEAIAALARALRPELGKEMPR